MWDLIERGWYTSPLGGIAREAKDKWYFYPRTSPEMVGPFKTLADAKKSAETSPSDSNGERS